MVQSRKYPSGECNDQEAIQPMPVLAIPKLSEGQLDPLFRRLNLAYTRRIYQEVADRAEKENWTYRDFLALLLAEEVAHRKQTRLQRCTRQAHFPFFKTIDEFDFTLQSTLRQSLLGSYLGPDFVTEGRSLILYGKTVARWTERSVFGKKLSVGPELCAVRPVDGTHNSCWNVFRGLVCLRLAESTV
jgi:hypothetical protein